MSEPEVGSKWICQLGLEWTCEGVRHGIVALQRRDVLPGGIDTFETFPLPVQLFWQVMTPVSETPGAPIKKPLHARECGKPGPCEWCDSLQLTEDVLWFMDDKSDDYEGEASDRGRRLSVEVTRLQEENARFRAERYELLGLKTSEGLGAAEWMARTADAERRRKLAEAKVARVEKYMADDLNWKDATGSEHPLLTTTRSMLEDALKDPR